MIVAFLVIIALFFVQRGGAFYLLFYSIPFFLLAMLTGTGGLFLLRRRLAGIQKLGIARLVVLGYMVMVWIVSWALSPFIMIGITTGQSLSTGQGVPGFTGNFLEGAYSISFPLLLISLVVTAVTFPFVLRGDRRRQSTAQSSR